MIPEVTLSAVVFTLAALVVGMLGFRIRSRGDVHLIAGYDSDRVSDPAGLARFVGGICYALAIAALGVAAVLLVRPKAAAPIIAGFAFVAVGGIVALLVARDRYRRTQGIAASRTDSEGRRPAT